MKFTGKVWTDHGTTLLHFGRYPAPDRGTGYCFRAISFFLSLLATLRENGWPICMKFSGKVWSDHRTTWLNFGSIRVNRSAGQRSICLLSKLLPVEFDISFALAWWQHFLSMAADKSVCLLSAWKFHLLGGSRGRGLLCVAPQLVTAFWWNFTVVWGPRSKNEFVSSQNPTTPSLFCHKFINPWCISIGRS